MCENNVWISNISKLHPGMSLPDYCCDLEEPIIKLFHFHLYLKKFLLCLEIKNFHVSILCRLHLENPIITKLIICSVLTRYRFFVLSLNNRIFKKLGENELPS
jgi:hypothetical protein